MPTIRITDETMQAIRGAAIYDFRQTGLRQADGSWLIEISDYVAARLALIALLGEAPRRHDPECHRPTPELTDT